MLQSGIVVGKPSTKRDIRIFVLSKQTSLAYQINEVDKTIYLVLFWINKSNPKELKHIVG